MYAIHMQYLFLKFGYTTELQEAENLAGEPHLIDLNYAS